MSIHAPAPSASLPAAAEPRNGLAIASLVLGLIGVFLGMFAGVTWMVVIPLGILAVTFGVIGISRKRRGTATAGTMAGFGTALGAISLALGIAGVVIFAQAMQEIDNAVNEFDRQMSQLGAAPPELPMPTEQTQPLDVTRDAEAAPPQAIEPDVEAVPPVEPAPVEPAPVEPDPVGAEPALDEPAELASTTHTVVYRVTGGDSAASITYSTNGMGGSAQANGESLPWSSTERIKDDGLNYYNVIAQNEGSGKISCSITVDGKKVASETSTGPYAVVTCANS